MTTTATTTTSQTPYKRQPKPKWLKIRPPSGPGLARYNGLKAQSKDLKIATVCEEARCPNIGECWGGGTATFMIMGDTCTRGCKFCHIKTGNPKGWLDTDEPKNLATAIAQANWDYVVLTSVDRDDLDDGGSGHFAQCVTEIKQQSPKILSEVLIPDFRGNHDHLQKVIDAGPDVIAQNIETVERLTHPVRDPRAGYQQTLNCLARVKQVSPKTYTKSSIMLGLGETDEEILQCLKDLRAHNVDIVTLGQYLQPSPKQLAVEEFVTPEKFEQWKDIAEKELGFLFCASGPLVRSSYRAGELFMTRLLKG